jgi:hypothetical protein
VRPKATRGRFRSYAKPGRSQTTNIRMHARLMTLLGQHGGTARVEVATDPQILVNGLEIPVDLVPPVFARRLLENAALAAIVAERGEIINGAGFPSGELGG